MSTQPNATTNDMTTDAQTVEAQPAARAAGSAAHKVGTYGLAAAGSLGCNLLLAPFMFFSFLGFRESSNSDIWVYNIFFVVVVNLVIAGVLAVERRFGSAVVFLMIAFIIQWLACHLAQGFQPLIF